MTDILPYTKVDDLTYFCERNLKKKSRFGKRTVLDRVHVNASVLEQFYRKLDRGITVYRRNCRRRRK